MNDRSVVARYQAGERRFLSLNLRGANFRGQDLSGVDFSGADIRGADFTDAILKGADFTGATAGLQKRWVLVQFIIVLLLSVLLNFVAVLLSAIFLFCLFDVSIIKKYDYWPGILLILGQSTCLFVIAWLGLTLRAVSMVLVSVVVTGSLAIAGAIIIGSALAGTAAGPNELAFAVSGALALAGAVAGAGAIAVAVAVAGSIAGSGADTGAIAVLGSVSSAITVTAWSAVALASGAMGLATVRVNILPVVVALGGAVGGSAAVCMLSLYVAWRVRQGDEKFTVARGLGLMLDSLGGTSFRGADLSGADFTNSFLKNTSFAASANRSTNLTQTSFKKAKYLNRAQPDDSLLVNFRTLALLTGESFVNSDLSGLNLRGANLDGAQLNGATLRHTNLNEASLCGADLQNSNLTEAQLIGANLTGAYLTGACLEAWNINSKTTFEGIHCSHVFLLEEPDKRGNRERRPHDLTKDFSPGDFEKYFQELMAEVQILIKGGIDPIAFKAALDDLKNTYGLTSADIQGFGKKGEDILVTLKVPSGIDKSAVEHSFDEVYYARLEAAETRIQLDAEKRRGDVLEKITFALANRPIDIDIQALGQGSAMQEKNDSSRNISIGNIGGDFNASGQALNLGDISGQLINSINQLPDPTDDRPTLKTILTELQTAITSDSTLSDEDKAEALTQTKAIADAGQDPKKPEQKTIAKRALQMITGIAAGATATLTGTTGLLQSWEKLQPLLKTIFGL
jgi:uncharacterized protein YjbI with pentapeptide repeats